MKKLFIILVMLSALPFASHGQERPEPGGCIPIHSPGYVITKPGEYCFTKDIDTRLDFADHSAENSIVDIASNDVVLDMKGHRGGRGKFFVQHGGNGVAVSGAIWGRLKPYRNIVIKNGILTDFDAGVQYYDSRAGYVTTLRSPKEVEPGNFFYQPANIRIINVIFKHCTHDLEFYDWVPGDTWDPPSASEPSQ